MDQSTVSDIVMVPHCETGAERHRINLSGMKKESFYTYKTTCFSVCEVGDSSLGDLQQSICGFT